jgi:hypothetical protein
MVRSIVVALCVLSGLAVIVHTRPALADTSAPTIAIESDKWHVDASLTGVTSFVVVVKSTGMADAYTPAMPSPFTIDPWTYAGKTVRVSARAANGATRAPEITQTMPAAVPTVGVGSDRITVTAALPNTGSFVFVVKSSGMADSYTLGTPSPFLVDPWTYGGKTVQVSARPTISANGWAPQISFTVPSASGPLVRVRPDGRHVYASQPGVSTFVFVVKSAGMTDAYFQDVTPPFTIDPTVYGGRTISVNARASGPATNPWGNSTTVSVPTAKVYGIVDANGPQGTSGVDAGHMGITMDRTELVYGDSISTMDAKVALDTSHGLTSLVLLSQYGTISQFDLAGWQSWAASVVSRYGPGGTFWSDRNDSQYAPTYFELLNEPYGFWFYPTPEPAAYATFFKNVAGAAKAANPAAKMLLAGYPLTFRDNAGNWSPQTWDGLVTSSPDGPAAIALADAVTTHPYGSYTAPTGWPTAVSTHQDFPNLPVWITEVGFEINSTEDTRTVDENTQSAWLQRDLLDFVSWPWAQAFVWFKWEDYTNPDGSPAAWGVARADGTHRPSYSAFQAFIS